MCGVGQLSLVSLWGQFGQGGRRGVVSGWNRRGQMEQAGCGGARGGAEATGNTGGRGARGGQREARGGRAWRGTGRRGGAAVVPMNTSHWRHGGVHGAVDEALRGALRYRGYYFRDGVTGRRRGRGAQRTIRLIADSTRETRKRSSQPRRDRRGTVRSGTQLNTHTHTHR